MDTNEPGTHRTSSVQRRSLVAVLLVVGLVLAGTGLWLGSKWKRAADNINAMIVTPVTLPATQLPAPSPPPVQPAIAAAQTATTTLAQSTAAPVPTSPPTALPAPDQPLNILLLGTDRRSDQLAGRTDAVLLARIDFRQKRASLLSFPRDLWVKIPGHGEERVNGAYFVGETEIGKGFGPALAKQTVSELTGLPVQNFVMINIDGFAAIIDKIGGIELDVPERIDDPAFPTDDLRTIRVTFEAGCQRMNGTRALQYARTRHQDSDFKRNRRQQQVLSAIFNTVRKQNLFTQVTNIDEYTALLRDDIKTDLSIPQILSLAQFGAQLTPDMIHRYQIDSFKIYTLPAPATFAVDRRELRRLVDQFTGNIPDQIPEPGKGFAPTTAAAVECK